MQLSNIPAKLVLAFANSGGKNTIPVASQIGITGGAASLTDGFPPLTMTPILAGGIPPSGFDMNGILFELSSIIRWANAGGGFPYDAAFATDSNVGGYPKGARVMRSDGTGYWLSTVDNNVTDPESAGAAAAGWVPDFTSGAVSIAMASANVTLTPAQYGKPVIVITGTLTANLNLIFPNMVGAWTIINSTTGAFTITGKTAAGSGAILGSVTSIVGDGVNIYSARADLANTTDMSQGVALVGGAGRVVSSIATLKTLPKTGSATAFVTGYYVAGDGGGGAYYYDAADTTSTDNGGTIIVAADGGRWKLAQSKYITVRQFGANGDGVTNDTAKIQATFDWLAITGGLLWITRGVYLVTAAIKTYAYITVRGDGDASQILVATDIEVFYSDRTTASTAIFSAEFHDISIKKTFTGATTKYDIHLQNPNFCKLVNVHVQSGHVDSAYSATNVGGVFFDKPAGSAASAFCNLIENCWIQNNSIYFLGITDSTIKGGWVWGHVRQFAIRIAGSSSGNIDITGISGIIPSQYNGGIWLDGAGINQVRIVGNEWDGNPVLVLGSGIYCPQSTYAVTVANNTFWGCGMFGVTTTDPVGWTITGNTFWKCNGQDNFYDDIRIIGATFGPGGNTVSVNAHVMDLARTNKGYAIREFNSGANPTGNTYSSNGILGSTGYVNPCILVLTNSSIVGNFGLGSDTMLRLMAGSLKVDSNALWLSTSGSLIATTGTLDLTINQDTYFGNAGGFVGTLSVSTTRTNNAPESQRAVYAVMGHGSTATFTQLGTQNGAGGGTTFTLSMASDGVIRLTNTYAQEVMGCMSFNGTKGLA